MIQSSRGRKLVALGIAAAASGAVSAQPSQIEEISVIGQFVPDEKRATSAVSNVLDGQDFTRTGDSNIAEGLKRVAGLSTVDGKFVYVRGLGERYSSTLLNGAVLPSPEPLNRVVPLDLFPTAVLDSVLVQKTYSAQFPSEFGGGVLQLRTKKSTDEFFFNVSSSVGLTGGTSFKDGFTTPGGGLAWLGYDNGYRSLPEALRLATENGQELRRESQFLGGGGFTPEELQTIGRSLRNEYIPDVESLPPNFDVTASFGNFHELGGSGARINYFAALDYSNSWDTNEIIRKTYKFSNSGLEIEDDGLYKGTEHSIDVGAIATTSIDFNPNHNVRFTSVLLRKTDNTVSEFNGEIAAEANVRINQLEWVERELLSNQIQGDHYFPVFNDMVVNWRYSKVKAGRDSPDDREFKYDQLIDTLRLSTRADGNVRRFSVLDDDAEDYGVDLTMVFYGPLESTITAQAGYVHTDKIRNSGIRRFSFFDQGPKAFDPDLLVRPIEEILAPENIGPDGFELREFTRPTDNYEAFNESDSFYVQSEINFNDRLRLNFGARQEDFRQNVRTFDLFRDGIEVLSSQESDRLLPAFSATFINYDHQFRIAYSETQSRPDFRELSPAAFTNPINGREVVGNPELQIASIKNYDFRWEWYYGFGDYMSFGLFYKQFDKPIESIIKAGADGAQSFTNAKSGENRGIEVEAYKHLGFLGGIGEDFYIQSNIAFIDSEVEIAEEDRGILTNTTRPLQGQSKWLFNAQVGYEPVAGTTATLLYHYFGQRINEVGIEGAPDLIEQPFGELNFIFIQELSDHWKVTAKAKNVLDERSEITQGGLIVNSFRKGREFTFKLDYRF